MAKRTTKSQKPKTGAKTGAKTAQRTKKPAKTPAPGHLPLELSPHYRVVYSERQFARVDGDNLVLSFLSRDRRYPGSELEPVPDTGAFRPGGPTDEVDVEIEEMTVKIPIVRAVELAELIAINIRSLSPERLAQLGIRIEPAA